MNRSWLGILYAWIIIVPNLQIYLYVSSSNRRVMVNDSLLEFLDHINPQFQGNPA